MHNPVLSWTVSGLLALSALGGAIAVDQDELVASAQAAASGADNGACDAIAKAVSNKSEVFYPRAYLSTNVFLGQESQEPPAKRIHGPWL